MKEEVKFDTTASKVNSRAKKKILKLDREFQNRTLISMGKRSDLVLHIRKNEYNKRKVVQAQFKTMGCRMKKAGSCWNCNYGVLNNCIITPNQYIETFERELKNIEGDVLVLESLGSITDSKEFSTEVLKKVIKIAIENGKFNTILIETHISQIPEELVQYIEQVNKDRKHIGFEVGIEDMSPQNRMLINKLGVENCKIKEVYDILQKHKMGLGINLIYGFPFMNEKERIDAVTNSVKTISRDFPNAEIVLFLMSAKENTIMEYMKQNGQYKLPNPWGLVETTREILENDNIQNIITFSWFGEKEDPYIAESTCYTCPSCKEKIISTFRNINGTFDSRERKEEISKLLKYGKHSECRCYEKFKNELNLEQDGKFPLMRYNEFMQKVVEGRDLYHGKEY